MVRDAEAMDKLITTMLTTVEDESLLQSLGENVKKMALTDSAANIVDKVLEIIGLNKDE